MVKNVVPFDALEMAMDSARAAIAIELIGHGARVLSLSIRLFGNVFGEELVLAILFFLAGLYLAPLPMMLLGLFTGFIQAFIFCLLSMMYFAGAMEHAH